MPAQNLLTSQIIVDRALAVLTETPSFINLINKQYDSSFNGKGVKVGDTVSVRVPQPALVRDGRIMDIQPQIDKVVPVSIDTMKGVDTGATSLEMALQIDDYQEQFIDTKIPGLVTAVEQDIINRVVPLIPSTVGAYGALNSATVVLQAGAFLDTQLGPKADRNFMVNTWSQVDIVTALQGFFNSQSKIDRQYRKGAMYTDTLGFDWFSSNLTSTVQRGTGVNYVLNGVPADGASSIVVATGTGTLNIGDTFTIGGVFDVHPQTKRVQPNLKQFTVTTAVTPGGAGTWQITPALIYTGPYQNVSGAPASNAPVTIKGTSGVVYAQNVAFSRDAFYMVTADLPNPPKSYGVDSASRSWNGVTLRFQNGYDMVNDMWISRFDIAYGAGVLRPELAVRIPATVTAF